VLDLALYGVGTRDAYHVLLPAAQEFPMTHVSDQLVFAAAVPMATAAAAGAGVEPRVDEELRAVLDCVHRADAARRPLTCYELIAWSLTHFQGDRLMRFRAATRDYIRDWRRHGGEAHEDLADVFDRIMRLSVPAGGGAWHNRSQLTTRVQLLLVPDAFLRIEALPADLEVSAEPVLRLLRFQLPAGTTGDVGVLRWTHFHLGRDSFRDAMLADVHRSAAVSRPLQQPRQPSRQDPIWISDDSQSDPFELVDRNVGEGDEGAADYYRFDERDDKE
jgi:hypothetical protein